MPGTAPHVRLDVASNGVATITFDLPAMANALDRAGVEAFDAALRRCESDPGVGAVVLTGAGDHAFCAGFNLKEIPLAQGQEAVVEHFRVLARDWHEALHRVVALPKPVLAAVNGVAAGVGLGLTLAADLAVATDDARFLCAWHSIGLANDAGTSYSLARIVGFRRAMELMLTNRTLSAAEALEWQLVNRLYPRAEFRTRVAEIAADLAAGPTLLQGLAKARFHAGWRQSIEECTAREIENVMRSLQEPGFRDTLERFLRREGRSDAVKVRLP